MRLHFAAMFALIAFTVSACGTKGPLYLPSAAFDDSSRTSAGSKP